MTLAEARAEVCRRLEEIYAAPIFFSADDIDASLNDAYLIFTDLTEWNEKAVTLTLSSHRIYYDLRYAGSNEIIAIRRIQNVNTGRWLAPGNVVDFDRMLYGSWEEVVGEATDFLMRSIWHLGLFPAADVDGGTMTLLCTAFDDLLTSDSDTFGFHEDFHWAMIEYAVYDLLCHDRETKKALPHWDSFVKWVSEYHLLVLGRTRLDSTRQFGEEA